ncbi:MAG: PA14 domain-containing protein [Bacteroidota bacterium]
MIPSFRFRAMLAWLGMLVWSASQTFAQYNPATYQSTAPTFPVTYTDAQKAQQRTNGTTMMNALISAATGAQTSYTIPAGVYRISGGLYGISNRNNFTINGATTVEIWLEYDNTRKSLQWLSLNNCINIKIAGAITFDSEKLQFIQCTVQGWNAGNGTIDVQVMPGYDVNFTDVANQSNYGFNTNIFHYNPQGINLTRPFLNSFTNYDAADITKKRLNVGTDYFSSEGNLLQVGHLILIRNNIQGSRHPVEINTNCTDIEVNGLQSYYGPMWASAWSHGRFANINCSNYRRPGSNRLGGSEEPGNMDYVNELIYDGCNSGPGQDDGVNALRLMAWVGEQVSPSVVIMHVQPVIGEKIAFYDSDNWASEGTALVAATPVLVTDEAQRVRLITQINNWQAAHGWAWRLDANQPVWSVTLDRNLSIKRNSIVDRSGNRMRKITASNCYFADMNVPNFVFRGVDEIMIENNVLERGRWEAILAEPSRYWWEGPLPHNITIRNNQLNYTGNKYGKTIANTGKTSTIRVGVDGDYAAKVINNVTITGNTFRGQTVNPLMVKNSKNVTITNNTFITPEPENGHLSAYGQEIHAAIFVAADSNVTISGNQLVSATGATTALVQVGPYMDYTNFVGTDVPPLQPIGLTANAVSTTQFTLTWQDNALNENGFIIERKVNASGAYVQLATVAANTTSYQDNSPHTASDDYYYYRVRSYRGNLWSAFSNEASARLPLPNGGGLDYNYYEGISHTQTTMPDFNSMTPVSTGYTANFTLAVSQVAEYFGVVYWGDIKITTAGSYTFYTNSDDACKVYLDGNLVVNQGPFGQDQSGTVSLTAGLHRIRLEYFQGFGGKSLIVSWDGPGISRVAIPSSVLFRSAMTTGNGLMANYFNGTNFENRVLQRVDPTINFDWAAGSPDGTVLMDGFSARWIGQIQPAFSETYTFIINSDNGRRLWINDQLIIDKWLSDWSIEYTGTIALQAGQKYNIRLEYFEDYGGANCKLEWSSPSQLRQVVPQARLYPTFSGNGTGLSAVYFNGNNFQTQVLQRTDPTVAFDWGNGSPAAGVNADNFSARWTGFVQPTYSGAYSFYIKSDNGRRVWVNNQLVVDKWLNDWDVWYSGSINLSAGQKYPIKVEYFDGVGGANISLQWESADQAREVVRTSQLYVNGAGARFSAEDAALTLFPNPADAVVTLQWNGLEEESEAMLSIVNVRGQRVYTQAVKGNTHQLRTDGLAEGLYLIHLQSSQSIASQKLLIRR